MNTFYIEFNMKSGQTLKGIYEGIEENIYEVYENLYHNINSNIITLQNYTNKMILFVVQSEVEGFTIAVDDIFK